MTAQLDQFHKAGFQIDDNPVFEGWSGGKLWNGWECPSFEFDQALAIMTFINSSSTSAPMAYNETEDCFLYAESSYEEQGWEPDAFKAEIIETLEGPKKAYPIGAGYWTWDKAD